MTTIIGIKLNNRIETATEVQEILTKCGCNIRTRLGLHEVHTTECKNYGIILIEVPNEEEANVIKEKLMNVSGTQVKDMKF